MNKKWFSIISDKISYIVHLIKKIICRFLLYLLILIIQCIFIYILDIYSNNDDNSNNDDEINIDSPIMNYYISAKQIYSDLLSQYSYALDEADETDRNKIEDKIDEIRDTIEELQSDIENINNDNYINIFQSIITGVCTIIASLISVCFPIYIYKRKTLCKNILIESTIDNARVKLKKTSKRKRKENDILIYINKIRYRIIEKEEIVH